MRRHGAIGELAASDRYRLVDHPSELDYPPRIPLPLPPMPQPPQPQPPQPPTAPLLRREPNQTPYPSFYPEMEQPWTRDPMEMNLPPSYDGADRNVIQPDEIFRDPVYDTYSERGA